MYYEAVQESYIIYFLINLMLIGIIIGWVSFIVSIKVVAYSIVLGCRYVFKTIEELYKIFFYLVVLLFLFIIRFSIFFYFVFWVCVVNLNNIITKCDSMFMLSFFFLFSDSYNIYLGIVSLLLLCGVLLLRLIIGFLNKKESKPRITDDKRVAERRRRYIEKIRKELEVEIEKAKREKKEMDEKRNIELQKMIDECRCKKEREEELERQTKLILICVSLLVFCVLYYYSI